MCLIAASLLALRSAIKIGELPLDAVLWLVAAGIALLAVWITAERLARTMSGRLHCNVCGERLKGAEFLRNLREPQPLSYPFRLFDGTRTEQPVQALCSKCVRRARRHRASGHGEA